MIKLHKDFLKKELGLPDNAIKNTIVDTTRWSEIHDIVFTHDGKFYETSYSQGLTELQDEAPFEHSSDEIECYEVELKEIIVKKWIRK